MNMQKSIRAIVLMTAYSICSLSLFGYYTVTINGITWTYTVSSGKASLGGGLPSSPAVSTSTSGAITIPSTLGGYPVTLIGGMHSTAAVG